MMMAEQVMKKHKQDTDQHMGEKWQTEEGLLKEEDTLLEQRIGDCGGQGRGCFKEWKKPRQKLRDVNQTRPFREL